MLQKEHIKKGEKMKKKRQRLSTIQNKKKLLEKLSLGYRVTKACKEIGISRITYYRWLKEDDEFRKEINYIEENALDFVESSLFKQIKNHNTKATIFYLKTKGKSRGYF